MIPRWQSFFCFTWFRSHSSYLLPLNRREYQKGGLLSYNALVNQHMGHLIMAGLAGVQGREYFIDILHVFTLVMTVKHGGAFVLSARRKGRRRASREERWMKMTLWGKCPTVFSILRRRIKFSFWISKMHMACGLKERSTGTKLLLYSIKVEIKVPTDKLNIL